MKDKIIEGFENDNGFVKEHGFKIMELTNEYCLMKYEIKQSGLNPYGIVHGGIMFGLADNCAGALAFMSGYTPLTTIESIFQDKEIRCGKRVKKELISYDNTCKSIIIGDFGSENCNKGEYVSVTPYEELDISSPSIESREFSIFIRENPFFIIKGCIEARETFNISYDEYTILRKSRVKTKNLYSYAFSEYLVKDYISLDDVVAIGIDYRFLSKNNYYLIAAIINLMRIYQIQIPFIDISSNRIIFELGKDLEQSDEVSIHKK